MTESAGFWSAFIAGGIAGTSVDTVLFPLDTIKTRLQSHRGFIQSGGFKNTYKGLSSAIIGSAPSAALFFTTYEKMKSTLQFIGNDPLIHMIAASTGEIAACCVRVPTEVLKQRMQVGIHSSLTTAISDIYSSNGISGFYRAFPITIFREVPFACIQFPLYEYLKDKFSNYKKCKLTSIDAGFCGMVAGGSAAALTTPLDVLKTRMMLAPVDKNSIQDVFIQVSNQGYKYFFSGIGPRVLWISIGGSIFLGVYDASLKFLNVSHSKK